PRLGGKNRLSCVDGVVGFDRMRSQTTQYRGPAFMSLSPLKSSRPSGFSRRRKFPVASLFFTLIVLGGLVLLTRSFFGVSSALHAGHKAWVAGQLDLAEARFRGILE